jgi:hypothetical protein
MHSNRIKKTINPLGLWIYLYFFYFLRYFMNLYKIGCVTISYQEIHSKSFSLRRANNTIQLEFA